MLITNHTFSTFGQTYFIYILGNHAEFCNDKK